MPELLEISGLDDIGQEKPAERSLPDGLMVALGLGALFAIGYVANRIASGKSVLDDLGIITPCHKSDLTSKKPKSKQKWCLWTKNKSRILGRHPSKSRAVKQERLIEMKKHGIPTRR